MIGYAELAVLALFLLGGKKKPEAEEYVSPPGTKPPQDWKKDIPPPPHDEVSPPPYVPPAVPPASPASPASPVSPPPVGPPTALQTSAQAMLDALTSRMADGSGRGAYRVEDMEVYKAFQRQARITSDGMPGKGTMDRLKGVLSSMGRELPASIPIYPWKGAGGFHHPNAPEMKEWDPSKMALPPEARAPAPAPSPAPAPVGPPPPVQTTGFTQPSDILTKSSPEPAGQAAISMAYAVVKRYLDGSGHGPYRKTDMSWYSAFQKLAMGQTKPDGLPGAKTMAALALTVNKLGVTLPSNLPVFPFKRFDAPGDIRSANWNAPSSQDIS
jgi:hypothetical protein